MFVDVSPSLALGFSRPVQNVTTSTAMLCTSNTCATGSVVPTTTPILIESTNTWQFTPVNPLTDGTTYYIMATTAITDTSANQNPLQSNYVSSFTVNIAPTISSVIIGSGSYTLNLYPASTENIAITFSEPVLNVSTTTVTLYQGATKVALTNPTVSGNTYTFNPTSPIAFNSSFTLNISNSITDTSGNPLVGTLTRAFNTRQAYILSTTDYGSGFTWNGNLGGVAGANLKCLQYIDNLTPLATDPKLAGRNWSAMIFGSTFNQTTTRIGTKYYNGNDNLIQTAATNNLCAQNDNQSPAACTLINSIGVTTTNNTSVWTGSSTSACNNWTTSGTGSVFGWIGATLMTNSSWVAQTNYGCNNYAGLYCVAQD